MTRHTWDQINNQHEGETRSQNTWGAKHKTVLTRDKEQRKQSFLTLPKENQSSLGLNRNPPIFFFTNPRFVLLIRDRRFVLFCSLSSLVTNHATPTSYVIPRNSFRVQQIPKMRVYLFITFKIWIFFLTKMHGFATGGLYSSLARFFYGSALFILLILDCVTETPTDCNDRA